MVQIEGKSSDPGIWWYILIMKLKLVGKHHLWCTGRINEVHQVDYGEPVIFSCCPYYITLSTPISNAATVDLNLKGIGKAFLFTSTGRLATQKMVLNQLYQELLLDLLPSNVGYEDGQDWQHVKLKNYSYSVETGSIIPQAVKLYCLQRYELDQVNMCV